jgi:hypothetical protein
MDTAIRQSAAMRVCSQAIRVAERTRMDILFDAFVRPSKVMCRGCAENALSCRAAPLPHACDHDIALRFCVGSAI